MKRSERHKLKTNEVVVSVVKARAVLEQRRREVTMAVVVVVVILTAIGGYAIWRQRAQSQASAMLADALAVAQAPVVPPAPPTPATPAPPSPTTPATTTPATAAPATGATPNPSTSPTPATPTPATPPPGSFPSEQAKLEAALPKFLAVASSYPRTNAGIAARYHAAAAAAALRRTDEALRLYHEVIDRDRAGVYGQMARLGVGETEARAGHHDQAIATFKQLASETGSPLPLDAILTQLGRTYAQAGRTKEARETFQRVLDEFPQSPYATTVRQELDNLRSSS
ncbi:MAG: tetratricopeptide repeat protein [Acidobacteria bacterium]|nr:tetratricopeptide repeat protein [Acidobacteriota bacterium]